MSADAIIFDDGTPASSPSPVGGGVWGAFPSVAGIAYTSVNESGNVSISLPSLITSPRKRIEGGPSQGAYVKWLSTFKIDHAVWQAATNGLGTYYPKMRDTFVVDGITWTVHREVDSPANIGGVLGLWRLPSVYLEIDANLADTITITLPADSSDAYSSPLTEAGTATSYAARIQFDRNETDTFHGIQFSRSWYRVYVAGLNGTAANLPLGSTIKATAGEYEGQIFRVVDSANIDLLDELPVYIVTIDPVLQAAA